MLICTRCHFFSCSNTNDQNGRVLERVNCSHSVVPQNMREVQLRPLHHSMARVLGGFGATMSCHVRQSCPGNLPTIWNESRGVTKTRWRHHCHFCKELFLSVLKMLNTCEATGEFRMLSKYYLGVCPLCLSPPPGLMWPEYYATLSSIFHPSAIIQAAPSLDFCWPVLFPL